MAIKRPKLSELIIKAGYKPYILSLKMGYSHSVVYGWLKGEHEPSARDMIRLAKLLNADIETIVRIFGGDE